MRLVAILFAFAVLTFVGTACVVFSQDGRAPTPFAPRAFR